MERKPSPLTEPFAERFLDEPKAASKLAAARMTAKAARAEADAAEARVRESALQLAHAKNEVASLQEEEDKALDEVARLEGLLEAAKAKTAAARENAARARSECGAADA